MKRLHLVALPHTQISSEFCTCAYTSKTLKFCKMMQHDCEILLYAPEGPDVPGAKLIPCLTNIARVAIFGEDDSGRLPAWPSEEQSAKFNRAAIANLLTHSEPGDLVLLTAGWTHKPIADALRDRICIEPFVGYYGVLGGAVWAGFESYAHMHTVYAKQGVEDIRWFDAVIPPYYDPDEFPHLNDGDGSYLLFLGRLIERKGPHIAAEIAKAAGMKLRVAGPGEMKLDGDVEYLGPVNVKERAQLLAGAKAVLMPTTYFEPGGNVAIEAMAAGTPVIAPDAGVFSETIKQGVSGYRFRNLREAVSAVEKTSLLRPQAIRAHAQSYSLDCARERFKQWFGRVETLKGKGWYE